MQDVSADLKQLLIRESVRHTISMYYHAVDRGARDELVHVFTESAEMCLTGQDSFIGRDNIITALCAGAERRQASQPGNFQRHFLGNSTISVIDDGNARAVHYALVITELGLDHSAITIDDLVKTGGRWLIARRAGHIEWLRSDSRFRSFPGQATPFALKEADFKFPNRLDL